MARPLKQGLDYFPLDVDFFHDDKIRIIMKAQGTKAISVILCLLARIYRENGFYMLWDRKKLPYLVADEICTDVGVVTEVLAMSLDIGIFDAGIFENYGVLTSKGIQKRYFAACGKRTKLVLEEEFLLTDPTEFLKNVVIRNAITAPIFKENTTSGVFGEKTRVISGKTPVNDEKTPQSKVKESIIDDDDEQNHQNPINVNNNSPDDGFAEIITAFENNIHAVVNDVEKDRLSSLVKDYGLEWVHEAIKTAALNQGRTVRYIETILTNWAKTGDKEPWKGARVHGDKRKRRSDGDRGHLRRAERTSDASGDIDWSQFDNTCAKLRGRAENS